MQIMGMDSHYPATREDLYHVQSDIRQLQIIQGNHSERLLRLEKRQADDAAIKSVWNSPFPSVLSGTPQQGPVHTPSADVFDDFDDEHEQNILGSLQLEADGEPVRRGASRANSVRFDVSAMQGGNWGQTSRSSGEFAPVRPTSGFGVHTIERTLSHKSDGRQSSAGHSIHSVHSAPSGRTSSLGLEANFLLNQDDETSSMIPEPPPGLFILGSVPSIIRCWLDTDFSHNSLLYAVICTGAHKSMLDISLIEELQLMDQIQRNPEGDQIRLPVYLPEAMVRKSSSRPSSPTPHLPSITVTFDVVNAPRASGSSRGIKVFIGSEALRLHNADVLLSQNMLSIYGDDRIKLTVPFVRPEDDAVFKHLRTGNFTLETAETKPATVHFTFPAQKLSIESLEDDSYDRQQRHSPSSISVDAIGGLNISAEPSDLDDHRESESQIEERQNVRQSGSPGPRSRSQASRSSVDGERREGSGIWSSWRQSSSLTNGNNGGASKKANGRSGKGMKVLKPSKISTASSEGRASPSRSVSMHEVPLTSSPHPDDAVRKSQAGMSDSALRWDAGKGAPEGEKTSRMHRSVSSSSKTSNPIGGASAFAWMNPSKPKVSSGAE